MIPFQNATHFSEAQRTDQLLPYRLAVVALLMAYAVPVIPECGPILNPVTAKAIAVYVEEYGGIEKVLVFHVWYFLCVSLSALDCLLPIVSIHIHFSHCFVSQFQKMILQWKKPRHWQSAGYRVFLLGLGWLIKVFSLLHLISFITHLSIAHSFLAGCFAF